MDTLQALVEPLEVLKLAGNAADVRLAVLRKGNRGLRDVGDRDEPGDACRVRGENAAKTGRGDRYEVALRVGVLSGRWQLQIHRRALGSAVGQLDEDVAAGLSSEQSVLDFPPPNRLDRPFAGDCSACARDIEADRRGAHRNCRHDVDRRQRALSR
jgi:hypothetical protein